MKFLPLTRQVELDNSNPEKLVLASKGTYFYRNGNNLFYLIKNNIATRIEVLKRGFATKYRNEIWYPTVNDSSIVFSNQYEIWEKTGQGYNSSGWTFISNLPFNIVSSEAAPVPAPPFGVEGLQKTIYDNYFADDPTWFQTATVISTEIVTASISLDYNEDKFSIQWLGYFRPPTSEVYTFHVNSDDSAFLWVGDNATSSFTTGSALVANPGIHTPIENSGSISLTAWEMYPIRIQYGDNLGGEVMEVSINSNQISRTTDLRGLIYYAPFPYPL